MSALRERIYETPLWGVTRERDLLYVRTGTHDVLVIAADSDGGLGPKPADTVAVDGGTLGRFAVRVPLLEVVAAGAIPIVVVDTLAVEWHPTGHAILAGILAEAATAGVTADGVTGSTEENVRTVATGVGVTVLGRARIDAIRVGLARPGDNVVLLGRPMSAPGDQFGPDDPEALSVPALVAALEIPGVNEVLPIGSSGVMAEIRALARTARADAKVLPGWPVPPDQSGGPSTAAVLAVDPRRDAERVLVELAHASALPVHLVARLKDKPFA